MTNFNDNEYATLIGLLLHDTKYVEVSNMTKMAGLRKHAEVLVRKILNIGSDTQLMLGQVRKKSRNPAVNMGMENLGEELSGMLIKITNRINRPGSDATHTQHTEDFSDDEVEQVEDAILDLYALIFIRYFLDIQVSLYTPGLILHEFSFLPPIIRYKTWGYLYEKDKKNIQVVNKLCLSIIKTFSKQNAYEWLSEHSEEIRSIPYPTDEEKTKYLLTHTIEIMPGLYQARVSLDFDSYDNIYDLLYDKIADPRTAVNESGKMYKTFEDAIKYYNSYKDNHALGCSEEVEVFHSLMEFVYLGRRSTDEL